MKLTTNFRLKKPEETEYYNVNDFNSNAEIIDVELKKTQEAAARHADRHGKDGDDPITLESIGAAPAGYGLGTAAEYLSGVDLDTVTKNGWYRLATTCPNYPTAEADGIIVGGGTLMEVVSANTSSYTTIQTIYLGTAEQQGLSLRRYYRQDTKLWLAWEWMNPPMYTGKEYRTVERYGNKAVFKKRDADGNILWRYDGSDVWHKIVDSVNYKDVIVPEEIGSYSLTNENFLPSGADLNSYMTPGMSYRCPTQAIAKTIVNTPFGTSATAGFSLHVERTSGETGMHLHQILRYNNTNATTYKRAYNGSWGVWAKDYSTIDKPTPDELGAVPTTRKINNKALNSDITLSAKDVDAAPAGFGLGEHQKLTSADDLNTIWKNGWYYWTAGNAPSNAPNFLGSYVERVLMFVKGVSESNFVQEFMALDEKFKTIARRRCTAKTMGELEYFNPPMVLNSEYLTTECIANKRVYKRNNGGIIEYRLEGETAWKPYCNVVGAVPTTRKVNGKALSADITLSPSDIGAAKIETGYYVGTGVGGGNYAEQGYPCSLTFSGAPKAVMITTSKTKGTDTVGKLYVPFAIWFGGLMSLVDSGEKLISALSGTTLNWTSSLVTDAEDILNASNTTYKYIAWI